MPWKDGHVWVQHPREHWDAKNCRSIIVHSRWDQLKGTFAGYDKRQRKKYQAAYATAKRQRNFPRAFDVVERCLSDRAMDELADIVFYSEQIPILVFPHLPFDDEDGGDQVPVRSSPTNAIPFAFAAALAAKLGLEVNETIFQSARIGRTKMPISDRFLYQPSFEGKVEPRPYILLDDVVTMGGTFAALRSYIIRSGGSTVAATTLAHNLGVNQPLPVAGDTMDVLRSTYGPALDGYWMESFGHEPEKLTEAEAKFLVGEASGRGDEALQQLRKTFDQAAAKGRQQARQESSG